jgi:hypothetical protein
MDKIKFNQLPFWVQVAVVLSFYNTWVMIEEFIIDRFGYWQYLPFYKKGIFCAWDIIALAWMHTKDELHAHLLQKSENTEGGVCLSLFT